MGYKGEPWDDETSNGRYFAKYGQFSIGEAERLYNYNVASYSGNAGDELSYNNPFDQRKHASRDCAEQCRTWYSNNNGNNEYYIVDTCSVSNPTHYESMEIVYWYSLNYYDTASFSEMKVRPRT